MRRFQYSCTFNQNVTVPVPVDPNILGTFWNELNVCIRSVNGVLAGMRTGKIGAEFVVLAQFLEKRCRNCSVFVHFFAVKPIDSGSYGLIGL